MTLLELRKLFRTQSGRFDLVNADGSDNGATFFINAGIRHLDRVTRFQKSPGRVFQNVAAGSYLAQFTLCRAVQEVWMATSTERWQLTRMWMQDFRTKYTSPWASLDRGSPVHYTPALLRAIPETWTAEDLTNVGFVTNYMDVNTSNHEEYNGVLIAPPPDEAMMLEVVGLFYSQTLAADTDTNAWTVLHPEVVLMGAMMQLEIMQRNTQGVNDWVNAINAHVTEIEKDQVDQDISEVTQMKG